MTINKILAMLLCFTILAFSGCSRKGNTSDADNDKDIKINSEITSEIENGLSANVIGLLYDGIDGVSATSSNGKIYVSARVGVDFYIPLIARELCPIVVSYASKNSCSVDIVIQKYGTGENTSISWHTTDGEKGVFLDTTKNVTKTGATIDDICEYYSDEIAEWEDILLKTTEH